MKILVNSCISKMDRIGKESGKTESGREFQSLPVTVKILVNYCINKMDRIGKVSEKNNNAESSRVYP